MRLVVESAKDVLANLECPSSTADNSDDGSVLVLAPIVKICLRNFRSLSVLLLAQFGGGS